VATEHLELGAHQQAMSELDGYTVESGDCDPRGWTVVGSSGERIGEVVDLIVDTDSMKVRRLLVERSSRSTAATEAFLVDIAGADLREDTREVYVSDYSTNAAGRSDATDASRFAASTTDRTDRLSSTGAATDRTLTRSEEELQIGKREVSRGEVRVTKHVTTEHVTQPVTRRREEVVVERRPVASGTRTPDPIGEDEVRIPLTEEEVVVEKRPVVKEELVIGKRTVEERDVVNAEVRREEFDVDENVNRTSDTTAPHGGHGRK
jgi:uncharacterized protein (TIGR02271 family)